MVSIHAPTRGATSGSATLVHCMIVSIHAPTRGATRHKRKLSSVLNCFNPRTHTGCDLAFDIYLLFVRFQSTHPHGVRLVPASAFRDLTKVSIHAPTRGATFDAVYSCFFRYVSIHAPTRGATMPLYIPSLPFEVSIHAPTRGATMLVCSYFRSTQSFNPRTHTGCDKNIQGLEHFVGQFQSTHPHGVRHSLSAP